MSLKRKDQEKGGNKQGKNTTPPYLSRKSQDGLETVIYR